MKRHKQIFKLLDEFLLEEKVRNVRIVGGISGLTLYEGSLLYVPVVHCQDYVLKYEITDDWLVITSTATAA